MLYVLTFPSILAQMLYVRGVELIGANRASLFINLIPVFGTLGSVLILGERLEGFHLLAGGTDHPRHLAGRMVGAAQ